MRKADREAIVVVAIFAAFLLCSGAVAIFGGWKWIVQ